jgi:hypothetical protein
VVKIGLKNNDLQTKKDKNDKLVANVIVVTFGNNSFSFVLLRTVQIIEGTSVNQVTRAKRDKM